MIRRTNELKDKADKELNELLFKLLTGLKLIPVPDYCNDWSALMPLVIENKISIRWLDGVNCWSADQVFDNQCGIYSAFSKDSYDDNCEPQRAVVISLIKTLEGNPHG